jgi:curved DNA-binding protein CbpA
MSEPYIDPYEALGLARSASADEVKRAYFALVRANPPERNPEQFKAIRAAYERLRDPAQRRETDMLLFQPWPEATRRKRASKPLPNVMAADVLVVLRALTDLDRTDWREQHEKVQL